MADAQEPGRHLVSGYRLDVAEFRRFLYEHRERRGPSWRAAAHSGPKDLDHTPHRPQSRTC
ncbi:hypothetical protein POF50_030550 [Streptomyces sp. SL13]|uniref:Uncharacterized protein n=1 Tax=Streptantibioticus silvisoli TaxID=2705255 RepID=A0AA90H512_9ACTN|nr:hypothetical protein [Streptantibioticus silvisoli]MDI5973629.1 hypothetical protein [Streptantibioticus silvisoli]